MNSRIRILIAARVADDAAWLEWQEARQSSTHAAKIHLQRVHRDDGSAERLEVGLGYGEALRWYGPIDDVYKRRLIIEYAEAVLDADGFPAHTTALSACEHGRAADAGHSTPDCGAMPGSDAKPRSEAVTEGLVLLSHAETDLLALERARSELPPDFPAVAGHSLIGLSASALLALFGARRSPRLLAIARLHGSVPSVPGLGDLIALAHREGWALVVISGAGGGMDLLPRTSNVEPEFPNGTLREGWFARPRMLIWTW